MLLFTVHLALVFLSVPFTLAGQPPLVRTKGLTMVIDLSCIYKAQDNMEDSRNIVFNDEMLTRMTQFIHVVDFIIRVPYQFDDPNSEKIKEVIAKLNTAVPCQALYLEGEQYPTFEGHEKAFLLTGNGNEFAQMDEESSIQPDKETTQAKGGDGLPSGENEFSWRLENDIDNVSSWKFTRNYFPIIQVGPEVSSTDVLFIVPLARWPIRCVIQMGLMVPGLKQVLKNMETMYQAAKKNRIGEKRNIVVVFDMQGYQYPEKCLAQAAAFQQVFEIFDREYGEILKRVYIVGMRWNWKLSLAFDWTLIPKPLRKKVATTLLEPDWEKMGIQKEQLDGVLQKARDKLQVSRNNERCTLGVFPSAEVLREINAVI